VKALTVEIAAPGPDPVLAPVGIATPHDAVTACMVTGGQIMQVLNEPELGLSVQCRT